MCFRKSLFPILILLSTTIACVAHDQPEGLFHLYRQNREQHIPNYITADFVVLCFGMALDEERLRVEDQILRPGLAQLTAGLLEATEPGYTGVAGTARQYLETLEALLQGTGVRSGQPPAMAEELALIEEAAGVGWSPILMQRLDYSRFRPQGRYKEKAEAGRYFQAWTYASAPVFYLTAAHETGIGEAQADHLTQVALYLTGLVGDDPELWAVWQRLEQAATLWFGTANGPTLADYPVAAAEDLNLQRANLLERFRVDGLQPAILSVPMEITGAETRAHRDAATGWKLISQRYTADSAAFGKLVYPNVGHLNSRLTPTTMTYAAGRRVKGFPSAIELLALLGNRQAGDQLDRSGDTLYDGYDDAFDLAGAEMGRAAGLNRSSLAMTRMLADEVGLETAAAFWTRCRYATRLYVAPSYTMIPKGLDPNPRSFARLERKPELYAAMAEILGEVHGHTFSPSLGSMQELIERLAILAMKQEAYDSYEIGLLNNLDLWMGNLLNSEDAPLTVDVHTDLNSRQVLYEVVGKPHVITDGNGTQKARGGRLSHFEYKRPMAHPTTDIARK